MLLLPAILIFYESAFDRTRCLWLAMGFYLLAKLFEQFDAMVFDLGRVFSGHSIKHLAASVAPWMLIVGMKNRKRTG